MVGNESGTLPGETRTKRPTLMRHVVNEAEIAIEIDRPVEEVFAAATDIDRFPDWSVSLSEVRKTSEGALGVDSTLLFMGKQLGRRYEAPVVVTEYVINERFTTKTTGGPFYIEVGYLFEKGGSGTRFTTHVRGESKGFFKVAEPIVYRITKKQFETAAETLKAMLEAAPAVTAGQ